MRRFSLTNMAAWLVGAAGILAFLGYWSDIPALWLLGVLSAIGSAGFWLVDALIGQRHTSALKHFAHDHRWTYQAHGGRLTGGLTGYPFNSGENQRTEDVVSGNYGGMRCESFTYRFDIPTTRNDAEVPQLFTVTAAELDVALPALELVPEHVGSRVLGALGAGDIEFESAAFNRTWQVLCSDKRFAVDVVDPRMMELLLRPDMQGWAVRIEGARVLVWSAGRAPVGDLSRRLDVVCGVAKRIPAHVLRRYDEEARQRRAPDIAGDGTAPGWATSPGVLNSRTYTGIGTDADGDGIEDWEQRTR